VSPECRANVNLMMLMGSRYVDAIVAECEKSLRRRPYEKVIVDFASRVL
jgi:hypothetical protein